MTADISGRIHYVNLLTGSGTVLGLNAFHAVLVNPNSLDVPLPVDTYENLGHNPDNYEAVYCELIQQIRQYNIELVSMICGNCPAQINGVTQAFVHHPDLATLHIPCLNHMVNLIFTHVLTAEILSEGMALLNKFIRDLRSQAEEHILQRKCPRLARTRWVCAVDVLRFILKREEVVNEVRVLLAQISIPNSLVSLYWILFPLKLFSFSMESQYRARRTITDRSGNRSRISEKKMPN
jgi:hypothetical protein